MQAGPDWPCRLPSCYPPVPPALLNPSCAARPLAPPLCSPLDPPPHHHPFPGDDLDSPPLPPIRVKTLIRVTKPI